MQILTYLILLLSFYLGIPAVCNAEHELRDPLAIFRLVGGERYISFNGRRYDEFSGFLIQLKALSDQAGPSVFFFTIADDGLSASELHILIESLRESRPNGVEIWIELVRTAKSAGTLPRSELLVVVCDSHDELEAEKGDEPLRGLRVPGAEISAPGEAPPEPGAGYRGRQATGVSPQESTIAPPSTQTNSPTD